MNREIAPNDRDGLERHRDKVVLARKACEIGVAASVIMIPFTGGLSALAAVGNGAFVAATRMRERHVEDLLNDLYSQSHSQTDLRLEPGSPLPPPSVEQI